MQKIGWNQPYVSVARPLIAEGLVAVDACVGLLARVQADVPQHVGALHKHAGAVRARVAGAHVNQQMLLVRVALLQ